MDWMGIYIYIYVGGGLCRGGLTPTLAPRTPVIIEDILCSIRQIEAVHATAPPRVT